MVEMILIGIVKAQSLLRAQLDADVSEAFGVAVDVHLLGADDPVFMVVEDLAPAHVDQFKGPGEHGFIFRTKHFPAGSTMIINLPGYVTIDGNTVPVVAAQYEVGADEYVTKPFSTKLLLVKVNALIKRYKGLLVKDGRIIINELIIEPFKHVVSVDGVRLDISPREYDLLLYFVGILYIFN